MAQLNGFFSYVREDDKAEGGRITLLAEDIRAQYQLLTGDTIELFLDINDIQWGDDWRNAIFENLGLIAFFIPIITPRYFLSPQCRGELQFFAHRASRFSVEGLILPIHYVDTPALLEDEPVDDLAVSVSSLQWEDWRELRFQDVSSEEYRRSVARLAKRLIDANRQEEETELVEVAGGGREDTGEIVEEDEVPGTLDQLVASEKAIPELTDTIINISKSVNAIGQIMRAATDDIHRGDSLGGGFAGRLIIARRVAGDLVEPVEQIWSSSNDYASLTHDIDEGVRIIIKQAAVEVESNPEARSDFCEFFNAVRDLSDSTHSGNESVQGMIDSIAPIEKMSRDIRPVMRRLRQGLVTMIEAGSVSDEWIRLIDESGLDCSK